MCHTLDKGGKHLVGPNLYGIYGRAIASAEGFTYSNALKQMNGIWTTEKLNRYIARPKLAVPGNQMPFPGLTSPHLRADLIAWLKTNPNSYVSPDQTLNTLVETVDIERGQDIASACLACHAAAQGAPHRIGPNLWGVVGRDIASAAGFNYSERLMRRTGSWSIETLSAFFLESKKFEQGSHMAFARLSKPEDRAAIIKWLKSLKDDQ